MRLSWRSARTDATIMVVPEATASTIQAPMSASRAGPNTKATTRTMPKTPALTTATACSSALTGVGATIADGSQLCSGMTAAFTLTPRARSAKRPQRVALPRSAPPRKPPAVNVASMPSAWTHTAPPMSTIPADSVYARYFRPARRASSVSR